MSDMKAAAGESAQDEHVTTILAVDDNPMNLGVISEHLKQHNYRIIVARDGESALERAEYGRPDLILMDVLMPGIDGFETCRRLKEMETLRDIPVIFMTALSETADKVNAFQAGGVDYIPKPFQQDELLARIQTHLELRRQRIALERKNQQLQDLEQLRDDLVHMMVHDLRSPLWCIHGYLEVLRDTEDNMSPDGKEMVKELIASSGQLLEMVSSMLDVSKLESGAVELCLESVDLVQVARTIFAKYEPLCRTREMWIDVPEGWTEGRVEADVCLITRVIGNLISNAVKFTPESNGVIRVSFEQVNEMMRVCVSDNGYGIPKANRAMLFEKYGQVVSLKTSMRKYSTGLGLPFCKLAVESHGGTIGYREQKKGTCIYFEIPISATREKAMREV